jgi:hypothetical protein
MELKGWSLAIWLNIIFRVKVWRFVLTIWETRYTNLSRNTIWLMRPDCFLLELFLYCYWWFWYIYCIKINKGSFFEFDFIVIDFSVGASRIITGLIVALIYQRLIGVSRIFFCKITGFTQILFLLFVLVCFWLIYLLSSIYWIIVFVVSAGLRRLSSYPLCAECFLYNSILCCWCFDIWIIFVVIFIYDCFNRLFVKFIILLWIAYIFY